jgi:molybdenum cofactor cytidylyltransferase
MNLAQALRIQHAPCLAIVGAGGKTTALFKLARQLHPPVIVTATTHLHVDQIPFADSHLIADIPDDLSALDANLHGVVLVTGSIEGDRTTGMNQDSIEQLHRITHQKEIPLLIEADGSRQHPIKAPAEHEPAIPGFVDMVIVVAGLSGIGKSLENKYIHRPEIFSRLSGLALNARITPQGLTNFLTHPQGGLKGIPPNARRVVLLNQADTLALQAEGRFMADKLLPTFHAVITTSLNPPATTTGPLTTIHSVREPVAAIILAAGEAKRFGQPKQLLLWQGKPFIQYVAEVALLAGLSPVTVVVGASSEAVESFIHHLPVLICQNPDWKTGQSSSIQVGLTSLPPETAATIFLLADQPLVQQTLLRALVERHSLDLNPVIAPQVQWKRVNPVLFDRITFPDLMSLSGDVGGRAIFHKYPPEYLPWHDGNWLVDIDTLEDYRKLVHDT